MKTKTSSLTCSLLLAGIAAACLPIHAAAQSVFEVVPAPNANFNNALFAVAASSPSDIWAVGDEAIHFDGATWTAFPVPGVNAATGIILLGVADISPTDAWAVGNITGGATGQVIWRWDGTQWRVFPGPTFQPGVQADLFGVSAISGTDIWAVGDLISSGVGVCPLLTSTCTEFEHWDGTAWTSTTAAIGGIMNAVSADATNDVWAVGFSGASTTTPGSQPLVTHYDGAAWQQVASPMIGSAHSASTLNGVVALAPNNVWATGYSIPVPHGHMQTLIEHYDGSTWSVAPSPNVGTESNLLLGIAADSPTDIWAFGYYFTDAFGHRKTLLLHWDGGAWSVAPSPSPKPTSFLSDFLSGGVVTAPGSVWIVGSEDTAAPHKPITGALVLHTTGG
jgi:hypothetical protein